MAKAKKAAGIRRQRMEAEEEDLTDEMTHLIEITLGDWSNDGHGITASIHINSTCSADTISNAMRSAVSKKKLPFDFGTIARDFDNSTISVAQVQQLKDAGVVVPASVDEDNVDPRDQTKIILDRDSFSDLYLACAKKAVGNKFKFVRCYPEKIRGIGYGLFSP